MTYLLLLHSEEAGWDRMTPEQHQEAYAAYGAYTAALREAGVLVDANRLQPISAATTVKVVDGKTQVQDGPYAETKEQLGGYYMIKTDGLDGAIAWAARCPGAHHGTVEIRPVWEMA